MEVSFSLGIILFGESHYSQRLYLKMGEQVKSPFSPLTHRHAKQELPISLPRYFIVKLK
jgi:hypothetical protein